MLRRSVFISGEENDKFSFEDKRLPRCFALHTQGSVLPFRDTGCIFSEDLVLEKNIHFVLLLAGTGSVLNSMECELEKSWQICSNAGSPYLAGASKVTSSAYPKTPKNVPPIWQPKPEALRLARSVSR